LGANRRQNGVAGHASARHSTPPSEVKICVAAPKKKEPAVRRRKPYGRGVRTDHVDYIQAPPEPEGLQDVIRWRADVARLLGFDEPEVALIAHRIEIDTHLLERLIRSGCSRELAFEVTR
jgi:hypothetical protein